MALSETRVLKFPGVRSLRRPGPPEFDLRFAVEGPEDGHRVLVFPGGPGLASILPYHRLRKRFAAAGYRIAMIEHRGVGASRRCVEGSDLPLSALTVDAVIDDALAVLDELGWDEVLVYGTSYGGWLAQRLAIAAPQRVQGVVLDSTFSSADDHEERRRAVRALVTGDGPLTAEVDELVRSGRVSERQIVNVVAPVYEFGGVELARKMLQARLTGQQWAWNFVARLADNEIGKTQPYLLEYDLVGVIMHREVDSSQPDGQPFDPIELFAPMAEKFGPYPGEPQNLRPALAVLDCPVGVVHGARDMRSPRVVAERLAYSCPNVTLVVFTDTGHSLLDSRPRAAVEITDAVRQRELSSVAERTAELERRSRFSLRLVMPRLISSLLTVEGVLHRVRIRR
ncbi:alpha/beta hydrolase [Hoyosella sp. YIM 151337]|uniref:alpha/beta hydrolase n=1 Tax=Hoyosella sp. YIM 151337 TaxID=2992742 RepID=UPI002235C4EA|nr:alpha/beta hydrolase [Hoyosella sp. YIM 151337]MCW4355677.1 alpha/beta hydrolase [Hoyosella sp. YIM 151337]